MLRLLGKCRLAHIKEKCLQDVLLLELRNSVKRMIIQDSHANDDMRQPYCRPPKLNNEMGSCYSISMVQVLLSTYSLMALFNNLPIDSSVLLSKNFLHRYKFYQNISSFTNDSSCNVQACLEQGRTFFQHMMLIKMGLKDEETGLKGHQKFYFCQIVESGSIFKKLPAANFAHLTQDDKPSRLEKIFPKNLFTVYRHVPILHFSQLFFQTDKFSHEWEVLFPGENSPKKKNFRFYETFDVKESYYYSKKFSMLIINNNPYDGKYHKDMPDIEHFLEYVAPIDIWQSQFFSKIPSVIATNTYTKMPTSHFLSGPDEFDFPLRPKKESKYHAVGYIISNSIFVNCNEKMSKIKDGRPINPNLMIKNDLNNYLETETKFFFNNIKNEADKCESLGNCNIPGCELGYSAYGHAIAMILNLGRTQWFLIDNHNVFPFSSPKEFLAFIKVPPVNLIFELTSAHLTMKEKMFNLMKRATNKDEKKS
ncbi:hypothetical protein SNEBB_002430 [Seison nebaliae]|nr:hypothetical protein SNEBB_002430 [Seison nebaliae]